MRGLLTAMRIRVSTVIVLLLQYLFRSWFTLFYTTARHVVVFSRTRGSLCILSWTRWIQFHTLFPQYTL